MLADPPTHATGCHPPPASVEIRLGDPPQPQRNAPTRLLQNVPERYLGKPYYCAVPHHWRHQAHRVRWPFRKLLQHLKLGNFNVSFDDLQLPVAGIPVTRTYDAHNANQSGDFGYGYAHQCFGWRVVFHLRLREVGHGAMGGGGVAGAVAVISGFRDDDEVWKR